MKINILIISFLIFLLSWCVGTSSQGVFGTGVSIALDPRSVGTQIDDNIMQKNLVARVVSKDKKYLIDVNIKGTLYCIEILQKYMKNRLPRGP